MASTDSMHARLLGRGRSVGRRLAIALTATVAVSFIIAACIYSLMATHRNPMLVSALVILFSTGLAAVTAWQISVITTRKIDGAGEPQTSGNSVGELVAIVESTDDAIIGKALDGTITTWNFGAEKLYGFSAEEAKGRHISIVIPPEQLEGAEQVFETLRNGGSVKHYRTISRRKDGTKVPVSLTISPIRDRNGRVIGSSTIGRDITERLEEQHKLEDAHAQIRASLAELELRNRWLNLFSQMTELLDSSQTPEEGYGIVADFAKLIFPSDCGALYVLNASRKLVEAFAYWGESLASEHAFSPEDCWALRMGKEHCSETARHSRVCKHVTPPIPAGSLCLPVTAQGEIFALLHLQSSEAGQFREYDASPEGLGTKQRLAATFGERIGVSLANLRLREQLRQQSIRDPLTGLFNRSYLEETLEREVSRAVRKQSSIGIIMLDIDKFKDFNDAFGHDAGDVLLREVGYFLKNHIRKQDIACRYGGEEFTLILPDASLEDTVRKAEDLRLHAREVHVKHEGQLLGPITFSFGIATLPQHGATPAAILKQADKAMYRAKAEGRDRVAVG